jgi:phage shock protein A
MNLLQRITATFTSTVGNVVSHVENHDAVVEAALKETHNAAAKARVRLTRLQRDGENMRRKLREIQDAEALWSERAIASAKQDEHRALECVKRRNACRKHIAQTSEALARHEEVEREVSTSVARIEQRLETLTQQRNMMRSRHSAADAMRVINRIEDNSSHGIEDIFDRWEILITETEYANGGANTAHSDAFDASFTKQENEDELKADLHALLDEQGAKPATDKE